MIEAIRFGLELGNLYDQLSKHFEKLPLTFNS